MLPAMMSATSNATRLTKNTAQEFVIAPAIAATIAQPNECAAFSFFRADIKEAPFCYVGCAAFEEVTDRERSSS